MICLGCGEPGEFRVFSAREMMFGTRERFDYAECPACASLQIVNPPADLARHYPDDYYALAPLPEFLKQPPTGRRRLARWLVTRLPGLTPMTRRRAERYPFFHWARLTALRPDDAVLDVGCGAGVMLWRMRRCGYTNLSGADPYLREEVTQSGFSLRRRDLGAIPEKFDLIMLHHVLEHLADPAATLRAARERLRPHGKLLVRLPVAASPLAREYGADWFNLDPPRHLAIPSRAGFYRLAARTGWKILHEETDSTLLSVLHGDSYRKNVALKEDPSPGTPAERKRARQIVKELNARNEGDCGLYVLAATESAPPPR